MQYVGEKRPREQEESPSERAKRLRRELAELEELEHQEDQNEPEADSDDEPLLMASDGEETEPEVDTETEEEEEEEPEALRRPNRAFRDFDNVTEHMRRLRTLAISMAYAIRANPNNVNKSWFMGWEDEFNAEVGCDKRKAKYRLIFTRMMKRMLRSSSWAVEHIGTTTYAYMITHDRGFGDWPMESLDGNTKYQADPGLFRMGIEFDEFWPYFFYRSLGVRVRNTTLRSLAHNQTNKAK